MSGKQEPQATPQTDPKKAEDGAVPNAKGEEEKKSEEKKGEVKDEKQEGGGAPQAENATAASPESRKGSISTGPCEYQRVGPVFKELRELLARHKVDEVTAMDRFTIGKTDALIVVDMQNDFVPQDDTLNKFGGRFGVAEGDEIASLIEQMIAKFLVDGGKVVATRDYHPINHVSFASEGGAFPMHCIQGHVGSEFHSVIGTALERGIKADMEDGPDDDDQVIICFKGFHEDIDSFGSFKYTEEYMNERLHIRKEVKEKSGCPLGAWTGCHRLKCSGLYVEGKVNVNAPPDVFASQNSEPLENLLKGMKRLFVCGLALDFCVLDTAINAVAAGFPEVYIVLDAARPAYIPGVGAHGSGFVTGPEEFLKKVRTNKLKLTATECLTHERLDANMIPTTLALPFPDGLGPFSLRFVENLPIQLDVDKKTYVLKYNTMLGKKRRGLGRVQALQSRCGEVGLTTTVAPVTLTDEARKNAHISESATHFLFAFPIADTTKLTEKDHLAFLATRRNPVWEFAVNGGFVYLREREVVGCNAISTTAKEGTIRFASPETMPPECIKVLLEKHRFAEVTIGVILSAGYDRFAWLHPGEVVVEGAKFHERWPHGAYAYLKKEKVKAADGAAETAIPEGIFFPILN